MRQINNKLSPTKPVNESTQVPNKPYPTTTPLNSGLQQPQQSNNIGNISEERVRQMIKEEVYKVF